MCGALCFRYSRTPAVHQAIILAALRSHYYLLPSLLHVIGIDSHTK